MSTDGSSAGPARGSRARAIAALVLLSTALKLAFVLAPRPDLYRTDGGPQATYVGEEIHRGSTAVALLEGPILPVLDYQHAHFFGGSLVVSAFAMPFVALFGPSIVAVKLAALVFNALAVALLFALLDRWASRRAAWIGGLLFAVASPGYALLATTAFGSHVESNALALACTWLALRLFEDDPPRPVRALALGALAGFAVWFSYITLLALAALALHRLLAGPRALLRPPGPWIAAWTAAGAALGLLPWLAYNLRWDFAGLHIYGRAADAHVALEAGPSGFARLVELATRHLAGSAFFRDLGPLPAGALEWLYTAPLLTAVALALVTARGARPPRAPRPSLAVLCALYFALFALAYALTDFRAGDPEGYAVSYRYLYTLVPFLCLAAALGLDQLALRGRGARRIALATAGLLVALGVLGDAQLVSPAHAGEPLATPGWSRVTFGRFLALRYVDRPERMWPALERAQAQLPRAELDDLLFGLGMQLRQTLRPGATLRRALAERLDRYEALRAGLEERVAPRYRPYFEAPAADARNYGEREKEAFWRAYGPRPGAE